MVKGFTYVLLSSKDGRTYTGSTDNLARRVKEHNDGVSQSTRNRQPLSLIYHEQFETIDQARTRERYLKTRKGRRESSDLLNNKL